MKYQAALDGIRAVSIAAVVGFHVAPARLPGGFVGVDLFFVLSGFLITTLVSDGVDEGGFSLGRFYLRRALRLLPNLAVMVGFVSFAWLLLMPKAETVRTAEQAIGTLACASNLFARLYLGNYWGASAKTAPLTHAWSLGIEEQFYLVFPLLLVALKRWPAAARSTVVCLLGCASSIACCWLTEHDPFAAFFLLPTRAWELLAGAATSMVTPPRRGSPVASTAGGVALVGLAACFLGMPFGRDFPGWVAWCPVLASAVLVWSVGDPMAWHARALSRSPLPAIGKRSYSIYLWHWPLMVLGGALTADSLQEQQFGRRVGAVVGVVLALAAYRFIEVPMRDDRTPRGRRIRLLGLLYGAAATVSVAVAVLVKPVADPRDRFDPVVSYMSYYDAGPSPIGGRRPSAGTYDIVFTESEFGGRDAWREGGIVREHGACVRTVLVAGDSHALMYSHLIDSLCAERGWRAVFMGVPGTAMFPAAGNTEPHRLRQSLAIASARDEAIRRWNPAFVFCINRWDARVPGEDEFATQLEALTTLVHDRGGRVVFVGQVPALPFGPRVNLREWASESLEREGTLSPVWPDRGAGARALATSVASRVADRDPRLIVIDPMPVFVQADGSVRYVEGRQFLYTDHNHLSEAGAELVRPIFAAALDGP